MKLEDELQKTKQRRLSRRENLPALFFLLLANLMLCLTIWILNTYDHISLDQVLYQIKSSTAGTNSDLVLSAFIRVCTGRGTHLRVCVFVPPAVEHAARTLDSESAPSRLPRVSASAKASAAPYPGDLCGIGGNIHV